MKICWVPFFLQKSFPRLMLSSWSLAVTFRVGKCLWKLIFTYWMMEFESTNSYPTYSIFLAEFLLFFQYHYVDIFSRRSTGSLHCYLHYHFPEDSSYRETHTLTYEMCCDPEDWSITPNRFRISGKTHINMLANNWRLKAYHLQMRQTYLLCLPSLYANT